LRHVETQRKNECRTVQRSNISGSSFSTRVEGWALGASLGESTGVRREDRTLDLDAVMRPRAVEGD
jgi:hypothetical protein